MSPLSTRRYACAVHWVPVTPERDMMNDMLCHITEGELTVV